MSSYVLEFQEIDNTKSGLSGEIRKVIEGIVISQDIHDAIAHCLSKLGEKNAYAVPSSTTAEDLPTSFCRSAGHLIETRSERRQS